MNRDPADVLALDEEAARRAKGLLEHPAMVKTLADLEAHYTQQWRNSELDTEEGQVERDTAFLMIRALDRFRDDLKTMLTGGQVTKHNFGAKLRRWI